MVYIIIVIGPEDEAALRWAGHKRIREARAAARRRERVKAFAPV